MANLKLKSSLSNPKQFSASLALAIGIGLVGYIGYRLIASHAASTVTVAGIVKFSDSGSPIAGAKLDDCRSHVITTDANGSYTDKIPKGEVFCMRVVSLPSNTKLSTVVAINNRATHKGFPSYEWQFAGYNCFNVARYCIGTKVKPTADIKTWDVANELTLDFTAQPTILTLPPVPPPSTTLTNKSRLGVDLNALPAGISLASAYDKIASIGFGWVRSTTSFDNYSDVTTLDDELDQAKRVGVKELVTISYAYGDLGSNGSHSTPKDPAAWAHFAGQLVAHWNQKYPGVVGGVEIWNEANSNDFWSPVNPVAYTDLLKRSYTEIKAAQPSMPVITSGAATGGGNLAASTTTSPSNPATFVQSIYANGGKGYFDIVGNHPYDTFNTSPNAWQSGLRNTFWIRQVMDANGDKAKQIWATEAGLDSCWKYPSGKASSFTEAQRAWILTTTLNDYWYGVHDPTDGHTTGSAAKSDWNTGVYIVFKLYKATQSGINDGSGVGFGLIYNTKSFMQSNGVDANADSLCANPPTDFYEPPVVQVITNYANHAQ